MQIKIIFLILFLGVSLGAAEVKIKRDLNYADDKNSKHTLHFGRVENGEKLPLIVYFHAGSWMQGSKEKGLRALLPFAKQGKYAVATVNYRFSKEAIWPAQIHDCKAAIRYLRANAEKFGIDGDKIAVWGASAGGQLASMLGMTVGNKQLEGKVGKHLQQSSSVSCVVNFCTPSDFTRVDNKALHDSKFSPLFHLFGGPLSTKPILAKNASPLHFVKKASVPVLHVHGKKDPIVPFNQAVNFHKTLKKNKIESTLLTLPKSGHAINLNKVRAHLQIFFDRHLYGAKVELNDQSIK